VDAAGDEVVAIFHSHPSGPAVPSATDRRESRYDAVHLVAGIAPGEGFELRAWRIRDGDASEVELRA
jgi:proteasome lid subunit RPN8/RPN11